MEYAGIIALALVLYLMERVSSLRKKVDKLQEKIEKQTEEGQSPDLS